MAEDVEREPRWRRGVPPQTSKRDQYLRLMNQGSSNSEACRTVGVNRRTGSRWRFGRTIERGDGHQLYYAPIATPVVLSGRFLSAQERVVIADGVRAGRSRRSIAAELKRSPSTISREVARNSGPDSGEYRPWAAQQQAAGRRGRPKPRKLVAHAELRQIVQQGLEQRWSPEQIANTLRQEFPTAPSCTSLRSRSTRRSTPPTAC